MARKGTKTAKETARRAGKAKEKKVHEVELVDGGSEAEVIDVEAKSAEVIDVEADDAAANALEDVSPATNDELDAIQRSAVRPTKPAPKDSTAIALRDPLAAYMSEVRRHPLLTREEEYELAVQWIEEGDKDAGRKLVTSNLRLVVKIANEYRRGYQNLLDLVQEGNIGLIKAVDKFDPYRGVKLSTYAGWWIRAYVLKHILNNWRMVKIGTTQNQRKLFFNLRKQQDALVAAGIDPTPENIAKELDVSPKEVVEMQKRLAAPDQSLNAPLRSDDDSHRTRLDMLEDDSAQGPQDAVEGEEFRDLLGEKLRRFGAGLKDREQEIFEKRLMTDEPVTLQSLGDGWGVSRERARQIEKRMLLRLRQFLQDELGDAVEIALGG